MQLWMVNNDYTPKFVQSLVYNQHPSQLDSDYKICYKLDLSDDKIVIQCMHGDNEILRLTIHFKHATTIQALKRETQWVSRDHI